MRPFFALTPLALVPLALAAGLALPAQAQDAPAPVPSSQDQALQGQITITGRGEVSAAPDTAYVSSGVTSQGETAREALDANSGAMAELIATLKEAGIDAKDIQTSGFSVSPNYVYSDARDENGYTLPPKITGYQVSNAVTVRVRDLPALGGILDKAVTVGANTINGVNFTIADPTKLYDEARKAAFADAKAKAGLYAELAGMDLGAIVSIAESQNHNQPAPYMARAMMADQASSVPVEAGELSYSINVTIEWKLAAR